MSEMLVFMALVGMLICVALGWYLRRNGTQPRGGESFNFIDATSGERA